MLWPIITRGVLMPIKTQNALVKSYWTRPVGLSIVSFPHTFVDSTCSWSVQPCYCRGAFVDTSLWCHINDGTRVLLGQCPDTIFEQLLLERQELLYTEHLDPWCAKSHFREATVKGLAKVNAAIFNCFKLPWYSRYTTISVVNCFYNFVD